MQLRIDASGGNVPTIVREDCSKAAERIEQLEARFAHVAAPSINPKSHACHICGLHVTDNIHVPEPERSCFEKVIISGISNAGSNPASVARRETPVVAGTGVLTAPQGTQSTSKSREELEAQSEAEIKTSPSTSEGKHHD
jgi:hypothetical protein